MPGFMDYSSSSPPRFPIFIWVAHSASMTPREEKLQRRAVKAGIRVAKRRHHLLSEAELRAVKVQIVPLSVRMIVAVIAHAMIISGACGWPSDANSVQALMVVGGILLLLFSIFGVRRTMESILDNLSSQASVEFAGAVLEGIASAVGSAIDL